MTNDKNTLLGGLSAEQFLSEFWQKKPLLIRQGLPEFVSPVTPDDLAGLSLEANVESRLISEDLQGAPWVLEQGPFTEERFNSLPDSNWTLLIQQLDAWSSEVEELKRRFNFIPDWRIDDVMASYAPRGGSVGPHFDHYDVFLVQAYGSRRWKLGQRCDETSQTRDDTKLSILTNFETTEEWLLNPGDILYIPPKLAHFGVAEDDCITLSVGFRAPKNVEMISSFADFLGDTTAPQKQTFFEDPKRKLQSRSGEITASDRDQLRDMLISLVNSDAFDQWLGCFLSEPKNPEALVTEKHDYTVDELDHLLNNYDYIYRNEGSRFLFIETQKTCVLFADGEPYLLTPKHSTFVQYLCEKSEYDARTLQEYCNTIEIQSVVISLIEQGSLHCDTDDS